MKKLLRFFIRSFLILLPLIAFQHSLAQVTVATGSPFSQYVMNLEGSGITIDPASIIITCDTAGGNPGPAMGFF